MFHFILAITLASEHKNGVAVGRPEFCYMYALALAVQARTAVTTSGQVQVHLPVAALMLCSATSGVRVVSELYCI
jgi:hypothetical protein